MLLTTEAARPMRAPKEAAMNALLPRNEHTIDRVVRVVLGLSVFSLLLIGPLPGWGLVGLVGIVPLATGLLGSCPIYTLFGISTCPMKKTEA
jgi:hypothetical protein